MNFEQRGTYFRSRIDTLVDKGRVKDLGNLGRVLINWVVQYRDISLTQEKLLHETVKENTELLNRTERLNREKERQANTIRELQAKLAEKQTCDACELVNSLRVRLAASEVKLDQVTDQFDRADIEVVECNATAVFNRLQLEAVRKEAINRISYLTRQNRKLKLEIERLKAENANNPQETSD